MVKLVASESAEVEDGDSEGFAIWDLSSASFILPPLPTRCIVQQLPEASVVLCGRDLDPMRRPCRVASSLLALPNSGVNRSDIQCREVWSPLWHQLVRLVSATASDLCTRVH